MSIDLKVEKDMVDPIQLDRLSDLAGQLNSQTDALNETIVSLEEKLAAMNLGVSAWLDAEDFPVCTEGPRDEYFEQTDQVMYRYHEGYELGYSKWNNEWKICARLIRWAVDETGEFERNINTGYGRPLAQSARIVRIEAADHLVDLIDLLIARTEKFVKGVSGAIKEIGDV